MSRQAGLIQVVVGLIIQNGRVLVAERPPNKPYSGYWEFPGGKIEAGETPLQALERELQEELGITVAKAQAWHQHEHSYPDKTVMLHLWQIHEFTGQATGREGQKLAWVAIHELESMRVLEGNRPILALLQTLA